MADKLVKHLLKVRPVIHRPCPQKTHASLFYLFKHIVLILLNIQYYSSVTFRLSITYNYMNLINLHILLCMLYNNIFLNLDISKLSHNCTIFLFYFCDQHYDGYILVEPCKAVCSKPYYAVRWRTEGGGGVLNTAPEISKAFQNRAKLNPIVKTVKNCRI